LLQERHVPHQVAIFPNQTHWFSGTAQAELLVRCADFLDRHLFHSQLLRKAG